VSRSLATIAVAGALAVNVGGCGSNSDEQDYVDHLNGITDVLREDVAQLSKDSVAVGDPEETAKVYEGFAGEFEQAATDAGDLNAPDQISDLNDRIVKDLTSMQEEAARAAAEVRKVAATDIVHIRARLEIEEGRLASDIDRAIAEINDEL
jgi:outer membrane murein-binding lipoprotein Lpp